VLFMSAAVVDGGLGFSKADAAIVYGLYTSMVWLLPLAGGWLADNVLGMRRAVLYGGIVIMAGHVLLALHGMTAFYLGLACVVLGTGLLKPNISGIVGQLYSEEDKRRDSGFSIFYMGINLGAVSSPLVCGWLAQHEGFKTLLRSWGMDPAASWHWGFAAAAVGMFFGVLQYVATARNLGQAGLVPGGATTPEGRARARRTLGTVARWLAGLAAALLALFLLRRQPFVASLSDGVFGADGITKSHVDTAYTWVLFGAVGAFFAWLFSNRGWSAHERRRLIVIAGLFVGSCVFWSVFEQAGSTLTFFAEERTVKTIAGVEFKSSWWQSVNGGLIVLLAPVFAWIWAKLGDFDRSSAIRFAIGILFAGLGFAVLIGGARASEGGARAGAGWLFTVYVCHTIGELCLSPVGLSSMTRFSPQRVQGLMLGVWFASIAVGTFLGSKVAGVYEQYELPTLFLAVTAGAVVMAVIMALLARPMARLVDTKD